MREDVFRVSDSCQRRMRWKKRALCRYLQFANINISRMANALSDENDGLRIWNIEATAATRTREHVVNAHHVVARPGKPRTILFVSTAWHGTLLRSLQPAHVIVGAFAAVRTTKGGALRLLLLIEKVTFVHACIIQESEVWRQHRDCRRNETKPCV